MDRLIDGWMDRLIDGWSLVFTCYFVAATSWSQPRRHHSGPALSPESGREKKKKKERVRVASSPTLTHRKGEWSSVGGAKQTSFSQIMDEQFADQLGQNEVVGVVLLI